MEIRWLQNILIITHIFLTLISITLEQNTSNRLQSNSQKNSNIKSNINFREVIHEELLSEELVHSDKKYSFRTSNTNFNNKNNNIHSNSDEPHSRKKRLIWITDDGRIALPPGTVLTITPTITLPLVRYPPEGFLSNFTMSFPLTIDFDKLGLTDNQNPLGDIPLFSAKSLGRAAGSMLGNYLENYLTYRQKREIFDPEEIPKKNTKNFSKNYQSDHSARLPPTLPQNIKHAFHGGERVLLYGMVEDFLATFGIAGKACLLRAICETHSRPIQKFGFFGEIIKLFLTPTKSPFSELLDEYVKAQQIGQGKRSPGECFPYFKDCSKSLFKTNKYYNENHTSDEDSLSKDENIKDNEILNEELPKQKLIYMR